MIPHDSPHTKTPERRWPLFAPALSCLGDDVRCSSRRGGKRARAVLGRPLGLRIVLYRTMQVLIKRDRGTLHADGCQFP